MDWKRSERVRHCVYINNLTLSLWEFRKVSWYILHVIDILSHSSPIHLIVYTKILQKNYEKFSWLTHIKYTMVSAGHQSND